ncbi:RNA polymerase II holoenzyme cyclin-like subunit [Penicillium chermesinum]|uniref:RNA polymerase II holoenzyme cyclin-like subunit n=1 Tax=Penicillium chermesinum TaxID=63820 RepID=A0A9W9PIQ3_9EURO|nr:RNA polymerase II holoenzyme cyclin-like subunit [Penicillium chermesinum]KAJ5246388.1 RNA polymerase II holoenzyme cyclin-like subunit [Penicillium chermesinum]
MGRARDQGWTLKPLWVASPAQPYSCSDLSFGCINLLIQVQVVVMAANYWASTQRRHWLFSREKLADVRNRLRERDKVGHSQYQLPDQRLLNIYFNQRMFNMIPGILLSRMQDGRVPPNTSASWWARPGDYGQVKQHPLWVPSAHYLQPVLTIPTEFITPDVAKLGECEFALISEMSSQLIVHHPYRTLSELQSEIPLSSDEVALAWSVINDHYLTDLPLLHPPSSWLRAPRMQNLVQWLAESEVDIKAVIECTQELLSLYEVWEQYNEKQCKELIGRMVKSKNLDK